jgi:hypothetical protein
MAFETLEQTENLQPRYDISVEEAKELCGDFLSTREGKPEAQFGCYRVSGVDRYSNMARFVESKVFDEYFENKASFMAEQYGPYEDCSNYFVVIDHEAQLPVGAMRLIEYSESGSKSLVDLKEPFGIEAEDIYEAYGIEPEKCADIATLAILKEYRGSRAHHLPSLLMYRSLYLTTLSNPDYSHTVAIMDVKAEEALHRLKFPFKPIFGTEPFSYLDSPESRAIYAKNSEFKPQLNYWASKFEAEAPDGEEGNKSRLTAFAIKSLVQENGVSAFDSMLAPEILKRTDPQQLNH